MSAILIINILSKMEKIMKVIFNRNRIDVFYPPDEVEKWKLLKRRYLTLGYEWIDLSTNQSMWKILTTDSKNNKKYEKMKRKNEKLRRRFSGHGSYPPVFPPPEPNNEQRFEILKRWSVNDAFNICMMTDYLTRTHNLRPCVDYEPDNLKPTYCLYSELPSNHQIMRSNTIHTYPYLEDSPQSSPQGSPLVSRRAPPSAPPHLVPPKYDDLNL